MGRSSMKTPREMVHWKIGFSTKTPLLLKLVYAGITGKEPYDCCSLTYVLLKSNSHNFLLLPQPKLVFRAKRLMTLSQSKKKCA
jgi:hypothetical protein